MNEARQLDSFHVWKVFVTVYGNEQNLEGLRDRRLLSDQIGDMSLPSYIHALNSPDFHWITELHLSCVTYSRNDFVQISKLTNIRALIIGDGVKIEDSQFDNYMIRSWARAASELNAFSQLRVLGCRDLRLTEQVFEYLGQFPSLRMVAFPQCDIAHGVWSIIKPLGWNSVDDLELISTGNCGEGGRVIWERLKECLSCYARYNRITLMVPSRDEEVGKPLPYLEVSIGRESYMERRTYAARNNFWFERPATPHEEKSVIATLVEVFSNNLPDGVTETKNRVIKASSQQKLENTLAQFGC